MVLDLATVHVMELLFILICGTLLLVTWLQDRSETAMAYWALAALPAALGVVLLGRGPGPEGEPIMVAGFAMLGICMALVHAGMRSFTGASAAVEPIVLAPTVTIVAWSLTQHIDLAAAASKATLAALSIAAALQLWRAPAEGLTSRPAAVLVLLAHGGFLGALAAATLVDPWAATGWAWRATLEGTAGKLVAIESCLFVLAANILMLAMVKERAELRYREAAATDPLTGLANRRGFVERAARSLQQSVQAGQPATVLVLDLDRFKSINDRFGHAIGDEVLVAFARVADRLLRPVDLVGRLGGEEFAAVLPGTDVAGGRVVAERLRVAFGEAGRIVRDVEIGATVSIGLATAEGPVGLEALLARADRALYAAKAGGRNRVVFADDTPETSEPPAAMPAPTPAPRGHAPEGAATGATA